MSAEAGAEVTPLSTVGIEHEPGVRKPDPILTAHGVRRQFGGLRPEEGADLADPLNRLDIGPGGLAAHVNVRHG